MERIKIKGTLNINYVTMFGKTWIHPLKNLFSSIYMFNLMVYVKEAYALLNTDRCQIMFPSERDLFQNFRHVNYEDIKVVIIADQAFPNKNATGVPFAQPIDRGHTLEDQTILIERCLRHTIYKDDPKYIFDDSFFTWGGQGVFMLDPVPIVEIGDEHATHEVYWKEFNRRVINTLNDDKKELVFMLWGARAKYYERFIDKNKHYVLYASHPQEAVDKKIDWKTDCFEKCNLLLEKIYKKSEGTEIIYW